MTLVFLCTSKQLHLQSTSRGSVLSFKSHLKVWQTQKQGSPECKGLGLPVNWKGSSVLLWVGSNRKACSKTQIAHCFWDLHWRTSPAYATWRFNFVYVVLHWHCIHLILLEPLNIIELLLLCSVEEGKAKRWQAWREYLFQMTQSAWLALDTISYPLELLGQSQLLTCKLLPNTLTWTCIALLTKKKPTCRMPEVVFLCSWHRKVILLQSQLKNFHLNKEK